MDDLQIAALETGQAQPGLRLLLDEAARLGFAVSLNEGLIGSFHQGSGEIHLGRHRLRSESLDENLALLAHEIGHGLDLGVDPVEHSRVSMDMQAGANRHRHPTFRASSLGARRRHFARELRAWRLGLQLLRRLGVPHSRATVRAYRQNQAMRRHGVSLDDPLWSTAPWISDYLAGLAKKERADHG